jgi:hypothetical protein
VTQAAREANRQIAEKALRLHFHARVPFVCECSDPDCREFVLLLPQEYADARRDSRAHITLPDHRLADATATDHGDYWVQLQA